MAVSLARYHGAPLHVLHISTARELELFEPGPIADKLTTAEACVHFLAFEDRDFERLGTQIIRSTPRKPTLYKCGCSPFVDSTFRSSIQATIVSRQVAYRNGGVDDNGRRQCLRFGSQR